MSPPLQFPGVLQPTRVHAVRTLGVFPDQSLLWCLPQFPPIAAEGNLVFGNWDGSIPITFYNCVVDRPIYQYSTGGHKVGLVILDRRARWEFATISGRYNIRRPDGTVGNQRSVQQLAQLLLQALGDPQGDVTALPGNVYPSVDWDHDYARLELARLMQLFGCDLSLNTDNSITIVRLGAGSGIPATGDTQSLSLSVDPKLVPQLVRVICGPTLVESILKCEAVGVDRDGGVKPIDDLSYKPTDGWESEADWEQFPGVEDAGDRYLALQTVGRWFRIKSQLDDTLDVPALNISVPDVGRLLPLNRYLLSFDVVGGSVVPRRPRVTGKHWIEGNPPVNQNSEDNANVEIPWSLEHASGTVKFSRPVIYRNEDDKWSASDVRLTCAYGVRGDETQSYYRQEYTAPIGGQFGEYPIRETSLSRRIVVDDGGNTAYDNLSEVNSEAQALANAAVSRFVSSVAGSSIYRAIQPVSTNGVIRQINWSVDRDDGFHTYVSVNSEGLPHVPRRADREMWRQSRQAMGIQELMRLREQLAEEGIGRL